MPAFIMPIASSKAVTTFRHLDTFTQAYVEAMFWTECNSDNDELEDMTFDDLAPETLAQIVRDCEAFQRDHETLLDKAFARSDSYDESSAGHDYWLTRNHHGAGFWDRGLGAIGNDLTEMAHRDGETGLYLGDDGLLYLA
jgi:hypothetical protein